MFKNYLKISWKVLLRRRFFTFISLFGVALTLTVLLVATALLDHIFGPLAPETRLDRSLSIGHMTLKGEDLTFGGDPGYQFLDRYVRSLPGPELVSLYSTEHTAAVYLDDEKIELKLKRTDGEYWQILDFEFLEGRPLTTEDEDTANFVAVINRETRSRVFGGQPAVGRELGIDGQSFRVVGVVENVSQLRPVPRSDVWVPISTAKSSAYRHNFLDGFKALLMARDPADLPAIKIELQSRLADVELPEGYDTIHVFAETSFETMARDLFHKYDADGHFAWRLKLVIAGTAILFMLLPTLNLVNVNVSRILERASEIGVRKAFGASSRTLVGQFVVENVILTAIGGLLGFALAALVLQLLSESGLIPYARFQVSYRVLFWGGAITLFFGVFSGALPAWKMSRLHPVHALNGTPQS